MAIIKVNPATGDDSEATPATNPLKTLDYAMQIALAADVVQLEGTTAKLPSRGGVDSRTACTIQPDSGTGYILANKDVSDGATVQDLVRGFGLFNAWDGLDLYPAEIFSLIAGTKEITVTDNNAFAVKLSGGGATLIVDFTAPAATNITISFRYQDNSGNRPRGSIIDGNGQTWDDSPTGDYTNPLWITAAANTLNNDFTNAPWPSSNGFYSTGVLSIPTLNNNANDDYRFTLFTAGSEDLLIADMTITIDGVATYEWVNHSGNVFKTPNVCLREDEPFEQLLKTTKTAWDASGVEGFTGKEPQSANIVPTIVEDSGTTDGATTAFKLIQSGQNFLSTTQVGSAVLNDTDTTQTHVASVDSNTQLTLEDDIMATGEDYTIYDVPEGLFPGEDWLFTSGQGDTVFQPRPEGGFTPVPDLDACIDTTNGKGTYHYDLATGILYYHLLDSEIAAGIEALHFEVSDYDFCVNNLHTTTGSNLHMTGSAEVLKFEHLNGSGAATQGQGAQWSNITAQYGGIYNCKVKESNPTISDFMFNRTGFGDSCNTEGDDVSFNTCNAIFNRGFGKNAGDDGFQALHGANTEYNSVDASFGGFVKNSNDAFSFEHTVAGAGGTLINCVGHSMPSSGIKGTDGHGLISMINCIFADNDTSNTGSPDIDIVDSGSFNQSNVNVASDSNLILSHAAYWTTITLDANTVLGEDPLFVAANDARLSSTSSPAFGSGATGTGVLLDANSIAFDVSAPNMGAHAGFFATGGVSLTGPLTFSLTSSLTFNLTG